MKLSLTILFLLFAISCFSQTNYTLKTTLYKTSDIVSFITKLDITNATKDRIYLNGYVVKIEYEQAKKLHGKKIRVTGKVTTVKAVKKLPGEEIRQGREKNTQYIESPKIEIIK